MDQNVNSKKENSFISFLKTNGSKIISFLFILLILFYALNVAYKRAAFVDFYAIDGDFQNYDAWRRILHGFIPFKDFSVYLGLGHLYLGSLFTFIFGGSYASSLVAGVFLTITFTALTIFVITKLITNNTNVSLLASALFTVGYNIYPSVIDFFTHNVFHALFNYTTPGYSARVIRGVCIIFYLLIMVVFVKKVYPKSFLKFSICASLMNGFLILYSNDSGISGFLAASISYLILLIIKYRKNWIEIFKYVGIWILGSIISWFVILTIVSLGNIGGYFRVVLGTSGAQSWYYQILTQFYIFSITDIFRFLNLGDFLLIGYICLEFYLLIRNKNKNEFWIHLGLFYVYLSYFIDRWTYALITAPRKGDWLTIVLFASTFGYLIHLFKSESKNENTKKLKVSNFIIYTAFILLFFVNQIVFSKEISHTYVNRSENGKHFKGLGGYLSNDGVSLYNETHGVTSEGMDTLLSKVKGENYFSTYSSAIEVMTNKYSSEKEDYIIHALSKNQQKEYLETFKKGNYRYFLTPSLKGAIGSYEWIINANWYFYKYIFKHYHYVGSYSYADIWEKDDKNRTISTKSSVFTKKFDANVMQGVSDITGISVKTKKKIDGIANVKIKYSVTNQKFGTIHSNIGVIPELPKNVQNIANSPYYNLPISGEYDIPVYLKDGSGRTLLFPFPQNKSNLELKKIDVTEVISHDYKNLENQLGIKIQKGHQ